MQKFVNLCGGEWRVMYPLSALPIPTSPLTPIFRRMSLQLGMTAYWWRIGDTMLWLGTGATGTSTPCWGLMGAHIPGSSVGWI